MGDAITAVFGKCNLPHLVRSRPPPHFWPQPPHLQKGPGGSLLGKGPTEGNLSQPLPTAPILRCLPGAQRDWDQGQWGQEASPGALNVYCPGKLKPRRKAGTQRPDICFSCRHLCLADDSSSFISPWGLLLSFLLASLQLPARSLDSELC